MTDPDQARMDTAAEKLMQNQKVKQAMARICCCNGPILDKRYPAQTMVCCHQYVVEHEAGDTP